MVYSTYVGGSAADIALRIAVDSAGNAYVTGSIDLNSLTVAPVSLSFSANLGDASTKQQLTINALPGSKAGWTIEIATMSGGTVYPGLCR